MSRFHAYERDRPGRPWAAVLHGPAEVTGDDMVKAMDSVGVDGALLVSPYTMYRYDASYALDVRAAHPDRFAVIKPVDPNDPKVADTIAQWADTEGTRRHSHHDDPGRVDRRGRSRHRPRCWRAAARHSFPVNLLCWGRLDQVGQMAARPPRDEAGDRPSRAAAAVSSRRRRPSPGPKLPKLLALRPTTTS